MNNVKILSDKLEMTLPNSYIWVRVALSLGEIKRDRVNRMIETFSVDASKQSQSKKHCKSHLYAAPLNVQKYDFIVSVQFEIELS